MLKCDIKKLKTISWPIINFSKLLSNTCSWSKNNCDVQMLNHSITYRNYEVTYY